MAAKSLLCMVALVGSGLISAGDQPSRNMSKEHPKSDVSTTAPSKPRPARVRMVGYLLYISPEQAEELDSPSLKAAVKSKHGLRKHLDQFGEVQFIGLVDHQVDLATHSAFQVGASLPTPSGVQTFKGQTSTQVQYTDCGCIVSLQERSVAKSDEAMYVKVEVEVSNIKDSKIQLSPQAYAPIFYRKTHDFSGRFKTGEPEVFLSVDGSESAKGTTAFIYEITIWPITDEDD